MTLGMYVNKWRNMWWDCYKQNKANRHLCRSTSGTSRGSPLLRIECTRPTHSQRGHSCQKCGPSQMMTETTKLAWTQQELFRPKRSPSIPHIWQRMLQPFALPPSRHRSTFLLGSSTSELAPTSYTQFSRASWLLFGWILHMEHKKCIIDIDKTYTEPATVSKGMS